MSLKGLYQVGYVTHDIERAIGLVGRDFGLSGFGHFEVELELQTPDGPKMAAMRVGTAWAGATQVELIQPISGFVDAYTAGLPENPADPTPRFHHVAMRRESAGETARDVAAMGLPLVFSTGGNGLESVFVDARARLGHYLEFVSATPEGWALVGWPAA